MDEPESEYLIGNEDSSNKPKNSPVMDAAIGYEHCALKERNPVGNFDPRHSETEGAIATISTAQGNVKNEACAMKSVLRDTDTCHGNSKAIIGNMEAGFDGLGGVATTPGDLQITEDGNVLTDSGNIEMRHSSGETKLVNVEMKAGDMEIEHAHLEIGGMEILFDNLKMNLGYVQSDIADLEMDTGNTKSDIGIFGTGMENGLGDRNWIHSSDLLEHSAREIISADDCVSGNRDVNKLNSELLLDDAGSHAEGLVLRPVATVPISIPTDNILCPRHVYFKADQLNFHPPLSSSLPNKFPSYLLTSPMEGSLHKTDLDCDFSVDRSEILLSSSTTKPSSSSQQSPSKSKLDLNVAPLSKASLNFRSLDAAGAPQVTCSIFSDGEGRRPRRRLKSWGANSESLILLDSNLTSMAAGAHRSSTPPVVAHRELSASLDGRHALNYGPESALDDMLSETRMLLQESESEVEASGAEAQEQDVLLTVTSAVLDRGDVRQRRSRLRDQKRANKKGTKKLKKKHDLDELDDDLETPVDELSSVLTCPVCLDVFYNAYMVRPCGHTFCEPCLRRLSKYSRDATRITTCPICRNPINSCVRNTDLSNKVEFYHLDDYRRRHRLEKNNKYMRHPLPSSDPVTLSPKHQLSRIVSRLDRNRLARRRTRLGAPPFRIDCWRFLSLALGFALFKGLLLMALLCLYCAIYDHALHEKLFEISISGVFGLLHLLAMLTPKLWGFAGVFLFGCLFVVVLKFSHGNIAWNKPLHEHQRITFS